MSEELETPPVETPIENTIETPPAETETETETPATSEPLTFDQITLPEGVEIDNDLATRFIDILNNEATPQERAQALVDLQLETLRNASEANSQQWVATQEQWQNEVRTDPTIGGANLQPTLDRVNSLVTEYGTPALAEVFALTGAGNHVEVIKFLNNLATQLTEGEPVKGVPANIAESAAQKLFPSMKG